jgi:type I restriction enzyme S subunit
MFKPKRDRVNARWLHWLTKWPSFWEQCDLHSRGTSGQNRIRPERFLEIEIPVPPLPEQRRILVQIEEIASQIREARTLQQGSKKEVAALSTSSAEAVFRQLRDAIGTRAIGDVCNTITDGDHNTPEFTDGGVRFIFVGNVSSGRLHFENSKRVSMEYFEALSAHRVPEPGDVLYSAVGATLGIPAVVDTDEPFCFQRHVAILKPDRKSVDSRFVWHMLRSRSVFEKAWGSTTGSAQPTVPLRAIRQLPIPVPPLAQQRRIVIALEAIRTEVDKLKPLQSEISAELDALLPSILDRAFAGQL